VPTTNIGSNDDVIPTVIEETFTVEDPQALTEELMRSSSLCVEVVRGHQAHSELAS
jgi:hypothetical protein